MLKFNDGFTLIELLIVIAIVGILGVYVLGIGIVCKGNYWYSEVSVLRELKVDHPKVSEIIKSKRNVFSKSIITVKENGTNHDYCLDTNVLWNYEFSECTK